MKIYETWSLEDRRVQYAGAYVLVNISASARARGL